MKDNKNKRQHLKMKTTVERRMEIANLVGVRGKFSVNELSEYFCVSGATIRTDLRFLESMGYVVRSNGYVLLNKGAISRFVQPKDQTEPDNTITEIPLAETPLVSAPIIDTALSDTKLLATLGIEQQLITPPQPELTAPQNIAATVANNSPCEIGQSVFIAAGLQTRQWVRTQDWRSKFIVTNDLLLPSLLSVRDENTKIIIPGGQVNIDTMALDVTGIEHQLINYRVESTIIEVDNFVPQEGFFSNTQQNVNFLKLLRKITKQLIFIVTPQRKDTHAIHFIGDTDFPDNLLSL